MPAPLFRSTRSGLEGVGELTKQLRELGKLEDGKALRAAVKEGIKPSSDRARQLVPIGSVPHKTYKGRLVAPGFAKRSIVVRYTMSKDKQSCTAILGVRGEAFYILQFVELGTSQMQAQPWLRPAFYGTRGDQQRGVANSLQKTIEKIARK